MGKILPNVMGSDTLKNQKHRFISDNRYVMTFVIRISYDFSSLLLVC